MLKTRLRKIEKKVSPDRRGLLVVFQDEEGRLTYRDGLPVKKDDLVGTVIIWDTALDGL